MKRIIIFLSIIALTSNFYAQTISFSGYIYTNTTWSADTVKITGDVIVSSGVVLTINPGTKVVFQGYYSIYLVGELVAEGNAQDLICFMINDTTGFVNGPYPQGAWGGLFFDQSASGVDSSIVSYCSFSNSWHGQVITVNYCSALRIDNCRFINNYGEAISCRYSSPLIINNLIFGMYYGIVCSGGSQPDIIRNTIQNGNCGIFAMNSSPHIIKNSITNNDRAVFMQNSNPSIIQNIINNNKDGIYLDSCNSIISENSINYNGYLSPGSYNFCRAINCQNGSAIIKLNTIGNNIGNGGSGIFLSNNSSFIGMNKICNNDAHGTGCAIAEDGAAIQVIHSSPVIVNNLICNNTCENYGAISFNDTCFPIIVNNTIANNLAYNAGAIALWGYSDALLANNILWGNEALVSNPYLRTNQIYLFPLVVNAIFKNNCFTDTSNSNIKWDMIFQNNIFSDPLFTNPTSGAGITYDGLNADWSLAVNSPCINSGTTDTTDLQLPSTDIAGNSRIILNRIDMGAYETDKSSLIQSTAKSNEIDIYMYPNPSADFVTISIGNYRDQNLSLKILDANGKIIVSELISEQQFLWNKYIDLSAWSSGIYDISIEINNRRISAKKLIKQ